MFYRNATFLLTTGKLVLDLFLAFVTRVLP